MIKLGLVFILDDCGRKMKAVRFTIVPAAHDLCDGRSLLLTLTGESNIMFKKLLLKFQCGEVKISVPKIRLRKLTAVLLLKI